MTEAIPDTMAAWQRGTYGPASGTRLEQLPMPAPGRGDVLLRVRATALNAGDVRLMLGDPLLVRLVFGVTRPKNPVRGMDVAGTVVGIGRDVIGVELGEEVICELAGGGGLAPYAVVAASRVVPRPPHVSAEQAACLPIAGGTARQALDLADLGADAAGKRILILGASGGVGTFAVQLAALGGAEVWATCGERNRALIEHLGAAHVMDYSTPVEELEPDNFDVVIDVAGGQRLRALQRLVVSGGIVVLVAGDGGRVMGPIPRILKAMFLSIGSRRRIRSLAATSRPEVLRELLALVDDGHLTPVIEQEWPFDEAVAALTHVEAGHAVGKVVVRAP